MSLFDKMKRALGLHGEDEELYNEESSNEPIESGVSPEADGPESCASEQVSPEALSCEIFEAVVKLFNEIQPDFVCTCINTEQQRKYILDSIDSGVRRSLEAAQTAARQRGEAASESERKSIMTQLEKLKGQYANLEEQRNAFQNEQLSATRQKRALTERVHDLESQVEALTAEKEQFELESRSMQNKLRVLSVNGGNMASADDGNDKLIKQIADLTKSNEDLQLMLSESRTQAEKAQELEEANRKLRAERDKLQSDQNELRMRMAEAEQSEKRASTTLKELNDALEAAEANQVQSERQIEHLRRELITASKGDERLVEANATIAGKDREIADLKMQIELVTERMATAEAACDDAQKSIDELNAKISELQAEKESLILEAAEYRKSAEAKLEEKEAELKAVRASVAEVVTPEKPRRGRKPKAQKAKTEPHEPKPVSPEKPKISAIDELIDESEWLVAPSADTQTPPLHQATPGDDDFGYKAPPKKAKMADDANQLRLF